MSTTASPTTSEAENVPDIQALTQRILVLNQATEWWNTAMIVALVLAALAAIAVVGTTQMALKRAKQVGDAQSELIKAKDAQLALDLKGKDDKIAQALKDAADGNKATEDERMARVELEDKVAWRTFSDRQKMDFKTALDRFAGQLAECDFLSSDTEAFSFSSEIAAALRVSRWQVIPPNPYVMTMKATSLSNAASPIQKIDFGVEVVSTPDERAVASAKAVAAELDRLGFDATFATTAQRSPPSRVWITVQHRPLGAQGEAKLRAQATKQ